MTRLPCILELVLTEILTIKIVTRSRFLTRTTTEPIVLMHNSPKLPSPLLTDKMSDTYYFSKIILRPILKTNYKLLDNEKFIDCLETIAQSECDSRILLLDNFTKTFQFLGEWHEHKKLKYSNKGIILVI